MRCVRYAGLVLVLLAGCAAPSTGPTPSFGYCPDWVQAPGETHLSAAVATGTPMANVTLTPPNASAANRTGPGWTYGGHPLDMYHVRIDSVTSSARSVDLRAHAQDNTTLLLYNRTNASAFYVPLTGASSGQEYSVRLAPVTQNDAARPGPAVLGFTLTWDHNVTYVQEPRATVAFTLTYWYKVCGA